MATDNTTPAVPKGEPDAYDSMASVFDELVVPEPNTPMEETPSTPQVEGAAPTPEPKSDAAPAPAAPTGDATPPATEPPVVEPTAPAADATPPATPVEPPPGEVDWEARFKELEARVNAKPEPTLAAAQPEPTPTPEAPVYNEDEQAFITQYEKEWPDIVKGEALKRRAEYNFLVGHIFKEVNRVWGPLLERGSAAAETVAENETLNIIRSVHDDYDDTLYNDVHKWIGGLSGVRRKMAEAIVSEGEPQDVIDLITEFKTATGRKPRIVADAGATPSTSAAPAASVTEISAAAKKAASAMSVVDSKRTAVVQATDPNDFDGAWEEATASK